MYKARTTVTNPTEMSRLKYRIESFIKKKCGLRTLPRFTITYPYDHHVDTKQIQAILKDIINQTDLTANTKNHINLRTSIVNKRHKNIAEILTNSKKACEKYNPTVIYTQMHTR